MLVPGSQAGGTGRIRAGCAAMAPEAPLAPRPPQDLPDQAGPAASRTALIRGVTFNTLGSLRWVPAGGFLGSDGSHREHPKAEPLVLQPQPKQLLLQSQLQRRQDHTRNKSAFPSAHPSNPPSFSISRARDGTNPACSHPRSHPEPSASLLPGKHEFCRARAVGKAPPLPGQWEKHLLFQGSRDVLRVLITNFAALWGGVSPQRCHSSCPQCPHGRCLHHPALATWFLRQEALEKNRSHY